MNTAVTRQPLALLGSSVTVRAAAVVLSALLLVGGSTVATMAEHASTGNNAGRSSETHGQKAGHAANGHGSKSAHQSSTAEGPAGKPANQGANPAHGGRGQATAGTAQARAEAPPIGVMAPLDSSSEATAVVAATATIAPPAKGSTAAAPRPAVFGIGKAASTVTGASSVTASHVYGFANFYKSSPVTYLPRVALLLAWVMVNAGCVLLIRRRRQLAARHAFRPITLGTFTYRASVSLEPSTGALRPARSN